jgi:hypothetical protein
VSATFGARSATASIVESRRRSRRREAAVGLGADRAGQPDFRPRFLENFECRLGYGAPWWTTDWTPGPARIGRWFRYRVPRDARRRPLRSARHPADRRHDAAGADPDARPDGPPFHAPSLDLTIHFLEDTTSEWILTWVHARRARAGLRDGRLRDLDDAGHLGAFDADDVLRRRRKTCLRRARAAARRHGAGGARARGASSTPAASGVVLPRTSSRSASRS